MDLIAHESSKAMQAGPSDLALHLEPLLLVSLVATDVLGRAGEDRTASANGRVA